MYLREEDSGGLNKMTSKATVEDVFGESFARKLERYGEKNWRIIEALTADYTTREKNPPNGVSQTSRTRIKTGDVSGYVIRKAESEYEMSSRAETVKKLLRSGLQEIYHELGDNISGLAEIEDAITHSSGYLEEDIAIHTSSYEWELHIESSTKSERFYILWCQEFHANKLSETLRIPKSKVLQLAIIMAGRELGAVGEIPDEKSRKLGEIIETVNRQIERRRSHLGQLAFGAITTAWNDENCNQLHSKLEKECPEVLESFSEKIEHISEHL